MCDPVLVIIIIRINCENPIFEDFAKFTSHDNLPLCVVFCEYKIINLKISQNLHPMKISLYKVVVEWEKLLLPRTGKGNTNADALSRNPLNSSSPERIGEGEMQIAVVRNRSTATSTCTDMADLLLQGPQSDELTDFASKQPDVVKIIIYLEDTIR